MDAYMSLLNLNFMSSWRTGNSLVDMIIAIIIPLISNWVARFFSFTWPKFLKRSLQSFMPKAEEVKIQHGLTDRYQQAIDLTEGSVLQEAMLQYINVNVKPFYSTGDFLFSSVGSQKNTGGPRILSKILEEEFRLISCPSAEMVHLGNELFMKIREIDNGEDENGAGENVMDNGINKKIYGGNERDTHKLKRLSSLIREMILIKKAKSSDETDEVLVFVQKAYDWYVKDVENVSSTERFLYQPIRNNGESEGFYTESLMKVARYSLRGSKSFDSLFFPEKEKLISLVDQFESKKGKFAIPGFPHKLTLLLYGPPGTGKTSLVKSIARYTGRHIMSIPLNQVRTNRELIACMHDQQFEIEDKSGSRYKITLQADKVIFLLEDADAISEILLDSKKGEQVESTSLGGKVRPALLPDALSAKGVVDAFGGILDTPKRIIVITTNHIERLDSTLVRPGFITMRLYMGEFTEEFAAQMVTHYYGAEVATQERLDSLKHVLKEANERGIRFAPSEMEQLCAEYDNIEDLIEELRKGSMKNVF